GGVVIRDDRVLLVRAKPAPHDWVLPKGHIEPGETPEQTARREVQEEAGVDAEIVRAVGGLDYVTPRGEVRAVFFAMRFVREVPAAARGAMAGWTRDGGGRWIRAGDPRRLFRGATA